MPTIPAALKENDVGSKVLFMVFDGGAQASAAMLRAFKTATVQGVVVGDLAVYPTSGTPKTGYRATTLGTELAISSISVPCQGVTVLADPDNTEDIWVGGTGITSTKASTDGFRLVPGQSLDVPCRNVNTVFMLRGGAVNQGVYWSASAD